jgi:hypothetical protein
LPRVLRHGLFRRGKGIRTGLVELVVLWCHVRCLRKAMTLNVKPENKVYKKGEVYNNSKFCYNTK